MRVILARHCRDARAVDGYPMQRAYDVVCDLLELLREDGERPSSFAAVYTAALLHSAASPLTLRPKQYSYAVLYFFRVRIPILTKKEIYKERKLRFPLIRHFSHWKIE